MTSTISNPTFQELFARYSLAHGSASRLLRNRSRGKAFNLFRHAASQPLIEQISSDHMPFWPQVRIRRAEPVQCRERLGALVYYHQ
jgi:hypothetical protein